MVKLGILSIVGSMYVHRFAYVFEHSYVYLYMDKGSNGDQAMIDKWRINKWNNEVQKIPGSLTWVTFKMNTQINKVLTASGQLTLTLM
jgi:hypothetical protein